MVAAALGGNAVLQRGEPPDSDVQQAHIADAVRALAPLATEHSLIITHGNGPQIGLLATESVPVTRDAAGIMRGAEAVVDKDLTGHGQSAGWASSSSSRDRVACSRFTTRTRNRRVSS